MYLTVHAAAGGAIGVLTGNPITAFILGAVSHVILDIIPHGDENITRWRFLSSRTKKLAAAGVLDGVVLLLALSFWVSYLDFNLLPTMLAGMFGGIAPDAVWGFHELTGAPLLKSYRRFHNWFHKIIRARVSLKTGILIQIPLLLFFSLIIIFA